MEEEQVYCGDIKLEYCVNDDPLQAVEEESIKPIFVKAVTPEEAEKKILEVYMQSPLVWTRRMPKEDYTISVINVKPVEELVKEP